jgi:hypothetical protein
MFTYCPEYFGNPDTVLMNLYLTECKMGEWMMANSRPGDALVFLDRSARQLTRLGKHDCARPAQYALITALAELGETDRMLSTYEKVIAMYEKGAREGMFTALELAEARASLGSAMDAVVWGAECSQLVVMTWVKDLLQAEEGA